MFKTAGFLKRQYGRLTSFLDWFGGKSYWAWVTAKEGVHHMIHGLQVLFKDGKWAVKHRSSRSIYQPENY
jgi:hypothetical protein